MRELISHPVWLNVFWLQLAHAAVATCAALLVLMCPESLTTCCGVSAQSTLMNSGGAQRTRSDAAADAAKGAVLRLCRSKAGTTTLLRLRRIPAAAGARCHAAHPCAAVDREERRSGTVTCVLGAAALYMVDGASVGR